MRPHHRPHILAAAALVVVIVMLFLVNLGPQVPVDLRPAPRPLLGISRIPPQPPEPPYDIFALRLVLDELAENARLLRREAKNHEVDVDLLWNLWMSNFGVRGGIRDWPWFASQPLAIADLARVERLQNELFRLNSRGRQLEGEAGGLLKRLEQSEARWNEIRELALKTTQGEESVNAAILTPVKELRAMLAQTAFKLNTLDAEMSGQEADFDDMYPRLELFLQERLPGALPLARPWHWNYMLRNQPRPVLKYDFESRYMEVLGRAHEYFSKSRAALPPAQPRPRLDQIAPAPRTAPFPIRRR